MKKTAANRVSRSIKGLFSGLVCSALVGCGITLNETAELTTNALNIPALPLPAGFGGPVGTPAEVYSRVARGVLTCWLGPNGPMHKTHVFHAVSEPERHGGVSEIILYQRANSSTRKRGAKAAVVRIEPVGGLATVTFQNLRLDDSQADRLNSNVHQWAAANEGCKPEGIKKGWDAAPTANAAPKPQAIKTNATR